MHADDFDAFFVARRESLSKLIERAMGKQVARDLETGTALETSAAFEPEPEDPEDEPDELDEEVG